MARPDAPGFARCSSLSARRRGARPWTHLAVLLLCLPTLAMGWLSKGEILRLPAGVVPTTGLFKPDISANGRWVVFQSAATNLVPDGSDGFADIFLADTKDGSVVQVSRTLDGGDASQSCVFPSLSLTGRFVTYQTTSPGIVPDDDGASLDLFLYDRVSASTVKVGGGSTGEAAVSKTGRFVAFASAQNGLVDGDVNNLADVFVKDMVSGQVELISRPAAGGFADALSEAPAISANGRVVAFESRAALLPEDTNAHIDVYAFDRATAVLQLVSVASNDLAGNSDSRAPDLSANGRYVSFVSAADNLVPDSVAFNNIYRRDLKKGLTRLASRAADGTPATGMTTGHAISADGRFVALRGLATDLGPVDANSVADVYVKDMNKGTVERVSVGFDGVETDDSSSFPSLSRKAKFVAFESLATTLLAEPDAHAGTDVFVSRR